MQYVPRLEVAEEACRLCLIISTGTRTEQVYCHVFANYNGRYIYTIKTTLLIVIINAYSKNESTRNAGDVLRWISDNPEWKLFILGRGNLRGSPRISTWTALAFIIFINDLDTCTKLTSIMNKFADDTKLGHKVNTDGIERKYMEQTPNRS